MKILALDFSSPQRSVAVLTPGGKVNEVLETGPDTAWALAMIEAALRESGIEREQIECVAVGLGPGSYTGIRAAIALAQGWQLASRDGAVKFLGISSAEGVAAQASVAGLAGRLNVVIDAQREEFYLAAYEIGRDGAREIEPLHLASLAEVRQCEQAGGLLIGPEVTRWFPSGRLIFPGAATLARLASGRTEFVSGEKLEPIYLRETKFVKAPPPRVF